MKLKTLFILSFIFFSPLNAGGVFKFNIQELIDEIKTKWENSELKKKCDEAKEFIAKHKIEFISGSLATSVIVGALIYKYIKTKVDQPLNNQANDQHINTSKACGLCYQNLQTLYDLNKLACDCNIFYHRACLPRLAKLHGTCNNCRKINLVLQKLDLQTFLNLTAKSEKSMKYLTTLDRPVDFI